MKLKPLTGFVKSTDSFSNETLLCCSEMQEFRCGYFGTIFFGEIEQILTVLRLKCNFNFLFLFNCFIKSKSHLQSRRSSGRWHFCFGLFCPLILNFRHILTLHHSESLPSIMCITTQSKIAYRSGLRWIKCISIQPCFPHN